MSANVPSIDMEVVRRSARYITPIARHYFRSETRHLERIPDGQSIIVSNHDGGVLPVNAVCFGAAWHEHFQFSRPLYTLTHTILHQILPFPQLLADSGLIPADRENMDAALATGATVYVMPGAARETFRTYWQRREIDLGGRTGFISQAIRWGLPITPLVSVGSHETLFVLASGRKLAHRLGIPRLVRSGDVLPLLVGLPWGVWMLPFLPQIPLPAKITSEVLEPVRLPSIVGRRLTGADADDPDVVNAGFQYVLARMREACNRLYDERRWPVLG